MKLLLTALVVYLVIKYVECMTYDEVLLAIEKADNSFSQQGPTKEVLDTFGNLVNDIEQSELAKVDAVVKKLPRLYFKKALIELTLHKDSSAVTDLKKCLQIDPSMEMARTRLQDIFFESCDIAELELLTNGNSSLIDSLKAIRAHFREAQTHLKHKHYKDCVSILSNDVLPSVPMWYDAYELQVDCAKKMLSTPDDEETIDLIIHGLQKLINLRPIHGKPHYGQLASFLLFTRVEFKQAWNHVRTCIKIDNEDKECGKITKFYSKFQKIFKEVESYALRNEKLYLIQGGYEEDTDINNIDFDFAIKFLLEDDVKLSKSELKTLKKKINTNYAYLEHLSNDFLAKNFVSSKQISTLKLQQTLNKLVCEALVLKKEFSKSQAFCSKIADDDVFFPKSVPRLQSLIKSKNYSEAKQILDKVPQNVRNTELFNMYNSIVEKSFRRSRQQQYQQQQRQQQQQQQQYRHYQQQQHYQKENQAANVNHDKDYYKILAVPRDVDDKALKKAYRAQTLKFHPDKNKASEFSEEEMEQKMQDINEAYEVLSDPQARENYDRGSNPNERLRSGQRGPGSPPGFDFAYEDIMNGFMKQGAHAGGGTFNFESFGGGAQRVKVKKNFKASF